MILVILVTSLSVIVALLAYITGWNHGHDFAKNEPQSGVDKTA
jgi:hypothetical protein